MHSSERRHPDSVPVGADIEAKNNLGFNSLMAAAIGGHYQVVKALVRAGKFDYQGF